MKATAYSQDVNADSLKQVLQIAKNDTLLYNATLQLAQYYWETNTDSSFYFGKKCLESARKTGDNIKIANAIKTIGVSFDYQGNLDSCLSYLNESVSIFKKINKIENQSHVLSDIAIAYYFRGNYELALRHHLQALQLRQQFGDKKFIAVSYNNLGLVYRAKKEYPKAIYYYKNSLQIKQEATDEQGMINAYMNIGSAFQNSSMFDSSYYYGNKALELAKKNNKPADIAGAESNMAAALVNLNRTAEALVVLERVVQQAAALNEKKILITAYGSYGDLYLQENDPVRAKDYFEKGLALALSNNRTEAAELFYRKLAKAFYQTREYKKAYDFFEKSKSLGDTLLNAENIRQMNELSAVYETAEKEKQISQLNAENKIALAENKRKQQQNIFLIITSVLFLGLALIAYKAFTANKKKKELLKEKNSLIEKTLQEKDFLMKEIHHRVKNNLQIVSSLLSLQSNYIKDEMALEAVNDSRNRVHSMSLIHQSLYGDDNLTTIDVYEYISKLADNLFQSYNIHPGKIQLIKEIEPVKLDVDTIVPVGLILNELITNCLKYAFKNTAHGQIKIMVRRAEHKLYVAVYDNGIGLPENFNAGSQKSFGHKMINAFLKKLNGTMKMYSEDGTKVEIIIEQNQ